MRKRLWPIAAGLALAAGVGLAVPGAAEPANDRGGKAREKLGAATVKILDGATRVETFRINGQKPGASQPTGMTVGGYPVVSAGREQGKSFAARLSTTLQDDRSLFSIPARCFLPGVAFRAWSGRQHVDVIVCYECSNLRVVAKDERGREVASTGGAFANNRAAWIRLAQDAFPGDPDIQKLGGNGPSPVPSR